MALPTITATINFNDGPQFGPPFTLNDSVYGKLNGLGLLAESTTPARILDVSNMIQKIDTKRGRNINQDLYESGTAVLRLLDPTAIFNPQNTLSPIYGYLQPLRKVRITATTTSSYNIYSGYTTDYKYTYSSGEDVAYVDIYCSDAFRLFNMSNITTITGGVASQDTGTRIGKILDMVSWPTNMRTIATGATTCQASSVDTAIRTVLSACRNCEQTEFGAFYMDGNGVAIFKSRAQVLSAASATPTVFAQDGAGIAYSSIQFAFDDRQVVNNVSATRTGGTAQTASDSASILKYFTHSLSYTNLIAETDADTLNISRAYVASRKDTTIRIDAITLDLNTPSYTTGISAALTLDYFSEVQISNTQPAGSIITQTLQVQGIAHSITPSTWFTTLTTEEPIIDGFILNSTIYGILDTSVLAY